jgi:hypothetical protein
MKSFGTPYYPEDINDEVYPGEIFGIVSPRVNNNILKQENSSVNNFLLSYDKNNMDIMKSKSIAPPLFDINNRSNNFTINNNYFMNNVINHISTKNNSNKLEIFHFDINIKNDKSKEIRKINITDLSIFKNSFSISSNNINITNNDNLKKKLM